MRSMTIIQRHHLLVLTIVFAATGLGLAGAHAGQKKLPAKAPVPEIRKTAEPVKTEKPAKQALPPAENSPIPVPRPGDAAPAGSEPAQKAPEPAQVAPAAEEAPVPAPRPAEPKQETKEPNTPKAIEEAPKAVAPPPALPSAEELACRTRLTMMGATFKEAKGVHEPNGCSMPFPVEISRLTDKIEIVAPVTLNCATAETSARFIRDVASPAAKTQLGAEIKTVTQASGFVCRPRNGTTKLSEHAFGNALDIASFTLTDGKVIAVEPAPPPANEKFLRTVRAAACGPFKTVLGPGSDADHAQHFHFDLAKRKNGGTFCQ